MEHMDFKNVLEELNKMSSIELGRLIDSAKTEQEQKFFALISDYSLQLRQKEVIAQHRY